MDEVMKDWHYHFCILQFIMKSSSIYQLHALHPSQNSLSQDQSISMHKFSIFQESGILVDVLGTTGSLPVQPVLRRALPPLHPVLCPRASRAERPEVPVTHRYNRSGGTRMRRAGGEGIVRLHLLPPRVPHSHNRRRRTKIPSGPPPVLPNLAVKKESAPGNLSPSIFSAEWTKVPLLPLSLRVHEFETLDGSCGNLGHLVWLRIVGKSSHSTRD